MTKVTKLRIEDIVTFVTVVYSLFQTDLYKYPQVFCLRVSFCFMQFCQRAIRLCFSVREQISLQSGMAIR